MRAALLIPWVLLSCGTAGAAEGTLVLARLTTPDVVRLAAPGKRSRVHWPAPPNASVRRMVSPPLPHASPNSQRGRSAGVSSQPGEESRSCHVRSKARCPSRSNPK
jgi:hypothetical protein